MKTVRFFLKVLCGVMFFSVALTSCRKELCYDHYRHGMGVKVMVEPEWTLVWLADYGAGIESSWEDMALDTLAGFDSLRPEPGSGMAAIVYNSDGTRSEQHIGQNGGMLPMGEGMHDILFYNDDTEYIVFESMDSHAEASASTRTRTRSTYASNHGDESTVNSPDMLYGEWVEDFNAVLTVDTVSLPVTMDPLVYKYFIIYEFEEGAEHIRLARGALAGMAGTVYLSDGRTGDSKVTILFDNCEISGSTVTAEVNSFGVPSFSCDVPEFDDSAVYGLNLETMLPNGKIKTFEFDITDIMKNQPRGGVIKVSGLRIEDGEVGSGGGFDVDVDDWGEYEDIILPL